MCSRMVQALNIACSKLGPDMRLAQQEGIEFVAMDFPGHGRSDHMSRDSWYSILSYPEYVIEAAR